MAVAVFIIIQITLRIMPMMMSLKTVIIKNGLTITWKVCVIKNINNLFGFQSFLFLFMTMIKVTVEKGKNNTSYAQWFWYQSG